jgi:CubicO group peptidase (beta-lactamase class C family)
LLGGPEKAGVGGSIPSLATTTPTTSHQSKKFVILSGVPKARSRRNPGDVASTHASSGFPATMLACSYTNSHIMRPQRREPPTGWKSFECSIHALAFGDELETSTFLGLMTLSEIKSPLVVLLAILLLMIPCPAKAQARTSDPPCGIQQHSLESISAEMKADQHHDLKGIVILCNGRQILEAYFNGDNAETLHDVRSATKSITATLMGIAIQQHFVQSVDDSIASYLPNLPTDGKRTIKIRDLLTMRSGLDADDEDPKSPGNENTLDGSPDWLKAAYAVPMKGPPGRTYQYCSLNAFLAGIIIENATHMPLETFARKNLFQPLGINHAEWAKASGGHAKGQGNLSIRTQDLATIGQLYLNHGFFNGHRVVNPDWIQTSWSKLVPILDKAKDPYADFYGYMWYRKDEPTGDKSTLVHFASGNGGNKIYVVPSRHLVIAITSSAYGTNYGQRRSQNILLSILTGTSSN